MGSYRFAAMGSPCEVQVECDDPGEVERLGRIAEAEARRIEAKYSRYRNDSVIGALHAARGAPMVLDEETAALFDYAQACWEISNGLFDVTSGILRRAWTFDGSDNIPAQAAVEKLLPLVGWHRVHWSAPVLTLPVGMEVDLGGLGKEYAVDRAMACIAEQGDLPMLVNFGGDLAVSGPRAEGLRWRVLIDAIEDIGREGQGGAAWLELASGAITTSGDARRYLERDGVRYGHILDPRTGYPVVGAPRAVTVAAPTCLEAGVLSTLAMLQGERAEAFLKDEGVSAWVTR